MAGPRSGYPGMGVKGYVPLWRIAAQAANRAQRMALSSHERIRETDLRRSQALDTVLPGGGVCSQPFVGQKSGNLDRSLGVKWKRDGKDEEEDPFAAAAGEAAGGADGEDLGPDPFKDLADKAEDVTGAAAAAQGDGETITYSEQDPGVPVLNPRTPGAAGVAAAADQPPPGAGRAGISAGARVCCMWLQGRCAFAQGCQHDHVDDGKRQCSNSHKAGAWTCRHHWMRNTGLPMEQVPPDAPAGVAGAIAAPSAADAGAGGGRGSGVAFPGRGGGAAAAPPQFPTATSGIAAPPLRGEGVSAAGRGRGVGAPPPAPKPTQEELLHAALRERNTANPPHWQQEIKEAEERMVREAAEIKRQEVVIQQHHGQDMRIDPADKQPKTYDQFIAKYTDTGGAALWAVAPKYGPLGADGGDPTAARPAKAPAPAPPAKKPLGMCTKCRSMVAVAVEAGAAVRVGAMGRCIVCRTVLTIAVASGTPPAPAPPPKPVAAPHPAPVIAALLNPSAPPVPPKHYHPLGHGPDPFTALGPTPETFNEGDCVIANGLTAHPQLNGVAGVVVQSNRTSDGKVHSQVLVNFGDPHGAKALEAAKLELEFRKMPADARDPAREAAAAAAPASTDPFASLGRPTPTPSAAGDPFKLASKSKKDFPSRVPQEGMTQVLKSGLATATGAAAREAPTLAKPAGDPSSMPSGPLKPWMVKNGSVYNIDFNWLLQAGPDDPALAGDPDMRDVAARLCKQRTGEFTKITPPIGCTAFPDGWEVRVYNCRSRIEAVELYRVPLVAKYYMVGGQDKKVSDMVVGTGGGFAGLGGHPSINRMHVMWYHHQEKGCMCVDLSTAHGTFINGKRIPRRTHTPWPSGQRMKLGMCQDELLMVSPWMRVD